MTQACSMQKGAQDTVDIHFVAVFKVRGQRKYVE